MQETVSLVAPLAGRRTHLWRALVRGVGAVSLAEWALAVLSAALLILSFPDFNLWPLAWVGLVPLAVAVVRRPRGFQSFLLGWVSGTLFFYGSTYWLTHAMIHFGGIPRVVAYPLLLPATVATGFFPGVWCLVLSRTSARWGMGRALALAPFVWAATEWARLGVTGQLWNALGYSQAYTPMLIQAARWGGVYAVGFLIAAVNAALVFLILKRNARSLASVVSVVAAVAFATMLDAPPSTENTPAQASDAAAVVVAVQPNVSANFRRTPYETAVLVQRHLTMSADALDAWDAAHSKEQPDVALTDDTANVAATPVAPARVVIWPESPMNFAYTNDSAFREMVGGFAREHRTAVIFNSLEPAPAGGAYNSAVLINNEGRLVAQYDKIRLLPFGEYVPLPRWLPATWLLAGIVGDFTPGEKYLLMPVGDGDNKSVRAGVFICFESAFPSIARTFADEGADVLVNISNDGYLGQTPVMRQHLANTVFRAVETNRPVLRVTNTGISALITPRGRVLDATTGFEPAVRTWTVARAIDGKTFYTMYGDIFAYACALISLLAVAATFGFAQRYVKY
ncbi:MAG TPA: apolipoprotein N-acyltransferase [Pyrinomonadaceae bacterium]